MNKLVNKKQILALQQYKIIILKKTCWKEHINTSIKSIQKFENKPIVVVEVL